MVSFLRRCTPQSTRPTRRSGFLVAALLICLADAAAGDFPEIFNTEKASTANWLSPQQAATSMKVPAGFRVSVFASEPEVQNPIAATWDSQGRLWVAENYTYAEHGQRFEPELRDRVLIFEGTLVNRFTKRTVFTENVQQLTSVEVGRGGVWLMCPPKLLFFPDANHDDVPDDEGQVVLDGFDIAQVSWHNFANGLRFGPDGWLYGRCGGSCPGKIGRPGTPKENRLTLAGGMWRYHPDTHAVEVLNSGTTNPWGHDWTDVGEPFFVNTVNGHLWHAIPGAHFTRPFSFDPNGRTYELIDFHADHWHFDTGSTWHQQRDGIANAYGGGHAHCGTMIYQGGAWPEQYHGRLFTLNFHGRRTNQEILERKGSGYVARHADDLFLAADPWFRGMEITSGPDGQAMMLDWSDTGECHEHDGVHRTSGRIFKITYGERSDGSKPSNVDVRKWSDHQLARSILRPNAWYRRQAKIEWADRVSRGEDVSSEIDFLKSLISHSDDSVCVHALLMLHLAGQSIPVRSHRSPHVRAWGIRLATERLALDDAVGAAWKPQPPSISPDLFDLVMEAADDPSPLVRLTCASTLQRLPLDRRAAVAKRLCRHSEDADDHNLPLMIWYGLIPLADARPDDLAEVAKGCQIPKTLTLIVRALTEQMEKHPRALGDVLSHLAASNDENFQLAVLEGVAVALRGRLRAPQPLGWEQVVALENKKLKPLVRELSVVFGDGRAIEELVRIASGEVASDLRLQRSALQSLIDINAPGLAQLCSGLLKNGRMNVLAARGLSKFDDPEIGKRLVARYRNFRAPQRPKLMSILVSRQSFAWPMLDAIESGLIPRTDLTPYQVRQLHGFADRELTARVDQVWGSLGDTPEEVSRQITRLKALLTDDYLAGANKANGRRLFQNACQTCHRLYDSGKTIGPNLTGSNRDNLDYLLRNIVSPSAVIDRDYCMTILFLDDDRIISGLVTSQNDQALTIQTATEELTFDRRSIVLEKKTQTSPMPDGLLATMTDDQIRDLIGYLRHPTQVPLP